MVPRCNLFEKRVAEGGLSLHKYSPGFDFIFGIVLFGLWKIIIVKDTEFVWIWMGIN